MDREPHRTIYIDSLYKDKNIEWLKKELESVRCIIMNYSNMIIENLTIGEDERFIKRIEHEREMKQKIEKYLDNLTNKNDK